MLPNVAVVGCGRWGKNLVRNMAALGALRRICDSDPLRLVQLEAQYPHVRLGTAFEDVLNDVDTTAIVIATPAAEHFFQAYRALRAGKDVFVEKPMALNVFEAESLVRLAEREGRILMVGHLLRYHPAVVKLVELVREGGLGQIRYVEARRSGLGVIRTTEDVFWSFAPHDISVMLALFGNPPVGVVAQAGAYLDEARPDVGSAVLTFPSGATGHLFVSWLHPRKEQLLVVVGDKGQAVFDDRAPQKLTVCQYRVVCGGPAPVHKIGTEEAWSCAEPEPLRAECEHFLHCMQTYEAPLTDGWEGVEVLRVLEQIQRSWKGA